MVASNLVNMLRTRMAPGRQGGMFGGAAGAPSMNLSAPFQGAGGMLGGRQGGLFGAPTGGPSFNWAGPSTNYAGGGGVLAGSPQGSQMTMAQPGMGQQRPQMSVGAPQMGQTPSGMQAQLSPGMAAGFQAQRRQTRLPFNLG